MAESCAASASCVKLHFLRCGAANRGPPAHWRKPLFRKKSHHNLDVVPHNAWKYRELSIDSPRVNVNLRHQATSFSCSRLGSLASFDGMEASEWVPVVDQVLLISSMLLTYLAGVAPVQKPYTSAKTISGDHLVSESSILSGRAAKINEEASKCAWDVVKKKLLDSLEATGLATSMGDIAGLQQDSIKRPLSLNAVAEGPKLRLLLAVVMHLEKEVSNIQGSSGSSEGWSMVLSGIVQKSLQVVCIDWLGKELRKDDDDCDVALPSSVIKKFIGDNTILLNIRKSGKEDLYADLLSFLRFGSVRDCSYYDNSLFVAEGISILEDLVVSLADGIASIYLELISVDGNLSNEMDNLSFGLCSLSTRSLQKLRNEVALNQWLHQNLEAVASMYEDRFDLSILQTHSIPESCSSCSYSADNVSWWKELFVKRPAMTTDQLQFVAVSSFSMPVKRTRELRALTGWRYYFSLFLELSDITMPLVRTIVDKVSNAISFFLVCLIGRSLGLIYTGIRQSLRWNNLKFEWHKRFLASEMSP